jgi:hypothetical protein
MISKIKLTIYILYLNELELSYEELVKLLEIYNDIVFLNIELVSLREIDKDKKREILSLNLHPYLKEDLFIVSVVENSVIVNYKRLVKGVNMNFKKIKFLLDKIKEIINL